MKRQKAVLLAIAAILCCAALAVAVLFVMPSRKEGSSSDDDLVIYSPHPMDMTDYIVREFRQRTGIRVKVISGGTGDLIDKVRKQADGVKADLFWGGGIESLETIKDQFQEYRSSEQAEIVDVYTSSHNLWSPFSVLPVVIIYNTKLVSGKLVPGSWSSLLDPYFKDHVIMADPATSGSAFTILVTMLRTMSEGKGGKADAWPFVGRFITQLGPGGFVPGSTTVYNSVAEGEFFAGITFENSALSLKKAGKDIDYRYPSEGTSAVPDGIALLKQAPHPEKAKRFIDFVLGHDVQSILMSKWFRRSVRKDVPAYQPDLSRLNIIDYPISESAAMRSQILSHWTELRSQSRP